MCVLTCAWAIDIFVPYCWHYDFLSLNKWKQQKQMFIADDAETFRMTMKNFESFTGQWQLLSAWRAMLELQLSLRTGSLRSWNDLHISFRETGTAVHMIFRQNFVVRGHWFSPKKVVILRVRVLTVRQKQTFRCCCCWQPHGLLICNSWFFFKFSNTNQNETLHSNVTLFSLL